MEKAAYLLYLFVLVFSPLAFGTIDLWALCTVEGCSFLALVCYLVDALRKDRPLIKIPGLVPLLLFLAWTAVQAIPLPEKLVAFISPATAALYAPVLTSSPLAVHFTHLSIYPLYTVQNLFRFSAYTACYFLTVQFLHDPKRMRQPLALALTIAAVISLYGIIQHYTGNDCIYWLRTFTHKTVFGTFAYKNHFAGYAELLFPLALALFFYSRPSRRTSAALVQTFIDFCNRGVNNQHFAYFLVSCLMVLALLLCGSRGGVFCTFVSTFLYFMLARKHFTLRSLLPAALGLILLVTITGAGRDGLLIVDRGFGQALASDGVTMNGRVDFWKAALSIISDFPITGTGAGTFRAIYPLYEQHITGDWPLHAHCDYLETQTSGGLIASLAVATFLFLFFRDTGAMYRKRRDDYVATLYLGSLAGLIALLIHCLIDLQFRISAAVGLYFFFLLGVNAASVTLKRHQRSNIHIPHARLAGLPGWSILAAVSLVSTFGLLFQFGELQALALFPEIENAEMRMGKAGYEKTSDLLALESFAVYKGLDAEKKEEVCRRAAVAEHFSPLNPRYHYIRSLCVDTGYDLDGALADCRAALLLSPAQSVYSRQYRMLLEKKGEKGAATL